ncbi:hypothetical protein GWI33_014874 [Rhynchophorus ferrugineus]|uniref:C2H2-type domain-containing protein n=1 Tax=Rhynchophorus ferrugineus TaxID=354439 RepID=A0A834MA96_RHYFE|nr:hypothetical protein GWI33_014874 [Rhynchophorus ferrugineus]
MTTSTNFNALIVRQYFVKGHREIKEAKKPHETDPSKIIFNSSDTLSDKGPFCCDGCTNKYDVRKALDIHKQYHCGREPQLRCSECMQCTYVEYLPVRDGDIASGTTLYPCDRCEKIYKHQEALDAHKKHQCSVVFIVTDEGRYACVKCGSSYKNKKHLKSHVEYECGVERRFPCDNCNKRFKHKKHLNRHVTTKVCNRLKDIYFINRDPL